MDPRNDPDGATPPAPALPNPPAPSATEPPSGRGRRRAVIVMVVVALLVAAGAVIANSNDDGSAASASPSVSSSSSTVAVVGPEPPGDLRAVAGAFRVVLTWSPSAGNTPSGYTIYRDGRSIGLTDANGRRYVDEKALPSSTYHYIVKAYAGDAGIESSATTATVKTKAAPAGLGRLQGVFEIKVTVDSSYGISGVGRGGTGAWRLTPVCKEGPCNVKFADLNGPTPNMVLHHSAAVYDGEVTGPSGIKCGGVESTGRFHVHLRVDHADVVAGAWRATEVSGTLSLSASAQLGCVAGGITYDVTGKLHQ
jgi:hypothetical protein